MLTQCGELEFSGVMVILCTVELKSMSAVASKRQNFHITHLSLAYSEGSGLHMQASFRPLSERLLCYFAITEETNTRHMA